MTLAYAERGEWAAGKEGEKAFLAIAVSLILHVVLFALAAVALISGMFQKGQVGEKIAPEESESIEMVVVDGFLPMDHLPSPMDEAAPEEKKPEVVEEVVEMTEPERGELNFTRTDDAQMKGLPERADFIGEHDTLARSDAQAVAGAPEGPSLRGEKEKTTEDVVSMDQRFRVGEDAGSGQSSSLGAAGQEGEAADKVEAMEGQEKKELVEGAAEKIEESDEKKKIDFIEPEEAASKLLAQNERKEKSEEQEKAVEEKEEIKKRAAQRKATAGGSAGDFASESKRTVVVGSMTASGRASLNVKNTALGRYQKKMFKDIEQRWQEGNFTHRSLIVPGSVRVRFVVDEQGEVSGQQRLAMVGASDLQWGMILRSLKKAKIQAMPKEVKKELNGEPLEIIVTFGY